MPKVTIKGKSESKNESSQGASPGDDVVARLFERHARQLARLAEQHLSRKLAGRLDGEDVVQSVFRTFFRRCGQGEIRIDSSAHIWRLLARITLLKARAKGRYHAAEKRDVEAEAPLSAAELGVAAAREPGPAEAVVLVDEIEALVQGLPPLYSNLLELRLEGRSASEIAQELGVSRRTVHRALHLLQQRLARSSADGESGSG
jgi:RNA polymerase sigma-70 factor (ECF subfamily)